MAIRTLSTAMALALAARITSPGFLVTIVFAISGTVTLSSRSTVVIDGVTYTEADLEVTGLNADAKGEQRGSVRIGNSDGAMGAIVLGEANADFAVTVQVYDAAAVATGDPVVLFEGTGNGGAGDERWVTIDLISGKTRTQLIPAEYITPEQGFSYLPPPGMRIVAGNEIYTLKPSRA